VLYLPLASVAFCRTQPPALVPSVKLVSVLIFPKKKKKKSKKGTSKKGRIKKRVRTGHATKTSCALAFFPGRAPPCAVRVFFFQAKKTKKTEVETAVVYCFVPLGLALHCCLLSLVFSFSLSAPCYFHTLFPAIVGTF
jgi:hypothetical protein